MLLVISVSLTFTMTQQMKGNKRVSYDILIMVKENLFSLQYIAHSSNYRDVSRELLMCILWQTDSPGHAH